MLASFTPERPIQVTVHESSYVVNGQSLELKQVTDLVARVPAGAGPAVTIERDPTSRAKAETDLKEALDQQKVPYTSD
jgi:hypothetical protein